MSAVKLLKKHVKGSYGGWLLAQLPSGRWATFWWATLVGEGNNVGEDLCESILLETEPKFACNFVKPSHTTRGDALQHIVHLMEKGVRDNNPLGGDGLKKARIALLRNKNR